MKDVIIIGTGICGLTAAVYAARADLSPLVIGGPEEGGQLTLTTDVENFPGWPDGIMGPELVQNTRKQAQRFGAEFLAGIVKSIKQIDGGFELEMNGADPIQAKTVIIATGASARWLGLESEKQYKGRGVSTCATCDGFFYRGKEVLVIGGGDSALEESHVLAKFATKVTLIHRRDELRASKIMQKRFFDNEKTDIIWNAEVAQVLGDDKKVTGAKLKDTKTGEFKEVSCDGIFLGIGHIPNTGFAKGLVDMDDHGYIKATPRMHTNIPGLFAAGDVQDTLYRQAITAAGSGCAAALEAEKYLADKE